MVFFIGVDVGTFESKGVLVDSKGILLATASIPHEMLVPQSGWAEHDPEGVWWGDVKEIVRKLLNEFNCDPREIGAICTSAIGPCMLPLDDEGRPLMNGVLYGVDTRAHREIEILLSKYGVDYLLDTCNSGLTSQSVGPKILWLKRQRPELYAKTRMVLSATSYIVHKLTGEYVMDHFTAAGYTPLYDPVGQCWNEEHCEGIIKPDFLPRLAWSSDIVGRVNRIASIETGLAEGTPVVCGTIDAAAEALSVGVTGPGDMMMMYGSTIFIIQVTEKIVRDSRLWYAPWLFKGLHVSQAGLATSGTLTRWMGRELFRDKSPDEVIVQMCREGAQSPPGARGVLMLPYFSGERTPIHDPLAKGVIFGLDLTHTRADIYRAGIEGIAHGVRHAIETFEEAGIPPRKMVAVGGGTKNPIWIRAVSDVSGYPQIVREKMTGASFGDGFLAALATETCTLDDIEGWNRVGSIQEPVAEVREMYNQQHKIFKQIYVNTRDLMAKTGALMQ